MYQIVLVIGSFMLLSMLTISVNNLITNKAVETYESESIIAATAIAEGIIQEISLRAFDDNVITVPLDSASSFTLVANLGKEAGEHYPFFDDIDDYKNYKRTDTIANGIFTTSVDVNYVTSSVLNKSSLAETFYKHVSVTVTDLEGMKIPITLSTVISY